MFDMFESDHAEHRVGDFGPTEALSGRAEDLLCSLRVHVNAFAVCEVGEGQALAVPPLENIVVHYVLSGSGSIQWAGGSVALEKGSVALIPRQLPKRLAGLGAVTTVVENPQGCVFVDGMKKFVTPETSGSLLRLACATVSAQLSQGLGLFDCLDTPLVRCADSTTTSMFGGILGELANPAVGSKSLIEASMKQILIRTFRQMLKAAESRSPFSVTLLDDKIVTVLNAIVSNPGGCHSLPKLAELAGMTPFCLSQRFQNVFGKSPLEVLQGARMDAAKDMLLDTRLPVKSIAAAVGFASRSHFSREFSKLVGQDPTKFRQMSRAG